MAGPRAPRRGRRGDRTFSRESPALRVAALLRQAGAELRGHDPAVAPGASGVDPAVVTACADPYEAARGADAIVVLTEWPEYRGLDWARLAELVAQPVVVDTRNLLDPAIVGLAGFSWSGLGARQPALR